MLSFHETFYVFIFNENSKAVKEIFWQDREKLFSLVFSRGEINKGSPAVFTKSQTSNCEGRMLSALHWFSS